MRLRRSNPHAFEGINATPLIDVVMCLIIFFLLVGKLALDRGAQIRLPESRSGETDTAPDLLIINVFRTAAIDPVAAQAGSSSFVARVMVEGKQLASTGELETFLALRLAERPRTQIQLRADRELPFGLVEPVLRACARAGAKSARLAAEKPS